MQKKVHEKNSTFGGHIQKLGEETKIVNPLPAILRLKETKKSYGH